MTLKPADTAIVMVVGPCIDDTDFKSLEESIAYDAAGMDVSLIVEKTDGTTSVTAITLTTGGISDWTHKDGGYYEIEVTAAQNAEEGIAYLRGICTGVLPFESPRYSIVKANIYDSLAKGTDVLQTDVTQLAGVTQSLTDLKDLADAGYDPVSHKIHGVVLVDGVTALSATAADLILKDSTFALAIADAIWDEILTGATHNIATSAGRRVREIGAYAIHSGTAQAGNSVHITLAAAASATDGLYNRNLLVLIDGTGANQTRTVIDYDGATKIATIDREWRVNPDATSEYQIVADDTPLVVDQGVAQEGTTTTIKLREYASSINDTYLCNIISIVAGTGRGQARLVGAYNGTTKVVTICGENWVTTPDNTSVYIMMPYGTTCVSCVGDDALAQINTECDTALTDYDPPTRTEATTDKNELIASLDTIKGTGWVQTSHSLAERSIGGNGGGGGTCSWWDADVELATNFFKSFQSRFDEIMLNFDKISSNIAEIDSDTSVNDSIVSSNKSTTTEIVSVKNSVKLLSNEIQTLSKELKTTDSLLISMADASSLEDLLDE